MMTFLLRLIASSFILLSVQSTWACFSGSCEPCFYDGQRFSNGSVVCQIDRVYECRDGSWKRRSNRCEPFSLKFDLNSIFDITPF